MHDPLSFLLEVVDLITKCFRAHSVAPPIEGFAVVHHRDPIGGGWRLGPEKLWALYPVFLGWTGPWQSHAVVVTRRHQRFSIYLSRCAVEGKSTCPDYEYWRVWPTPVEECQSSVEPRRELTKKCCEKKMSNCD